MHFDIKDKKLFNIGRDDFANIQNTKERKTQTKLRLGSYRASVKRNIR